MLSVCVLSPGPNGARTVNARTFFRPPIVHLIYYVYLNVPAIIVGGCCYMNTGMNTGRLQQEEHQQPKCHGQW